MVKRLAAIVALFLAIVAGVWFAISDEETSESMTDAAATGSTPDVPAATHVKAAESPKPADDVADADHVPPIRGYVHAIGGGPIDGALVELARIRDATGRTVLATTHTDAAGKFTLKAERWSPETSVTASAPGLARKSAQSAPGDYVDLALAVGGVLRGRVFDEKSGAPLAGALVVVSSGDGALEVFEDRTVTAADGSYEFAHVLPWKIYVCAVSPGRPVESAWVVVRAGTRTVLDFPVGRGGVVSGRVTRAGRPVAGARVSLWNGFDGTPVVTGDDGEFTLSGFSDDLSRGGDIVVATADGPVYAYARLPTKPLRELRADIDLTDSWTIRGVVTSGGKALARARLHRATWFGVSGDWNRPIETRDDGTFEIAAESHDPCGLTVDTRDGNQSTVANVPRPRAGSVADGVVIDLPVAAELRAHIVSADDGTPIAGARLSIPYVERAGRSDEAGIARMRLSPRGKCTVYASAEGFQYVQRETDVTAGSTIDLGDLALARAKSNSVAGHARTPDGSPLASVAIDAVWSNDCVVRVLTGADGGFRIDGLLPGPGTLDARFPGYADVRRENVTAGSEDVDLILEPIIPSLAALVTRADGFPAHRFSITGYNRRVVEGQPDVIGCMRTTSVHAPDGRFTALDWPWLDISVRVREIEVVCDDEIARVPVTLVEGGTADVRVALAPGATIRGTLSAPGGGAPDSVVWALRAGEGPWEMPSNRQAKSDRNGRFEIGPLVPGPYRLTVAPIDVKFPRHVVAIDVRGDATNDVIVTLSSGAIRVRVLDADGAPVAYAYARLLEPDGTPAFVRAASGNSSDCDLGRTAIDGTLTSPRIVPGRYRVQAIDNDHPPYRRAEADVEVRADETTDVEIRLSR